MKICTAMVVFALLSGSVCAAEAEWVEFASSSTYAWQGKKGSVNLGTLDRKSPSVSGVFRELTKDSSHIQLFMLFIKQSDCDRGQGKLIENDMDGNFKLSTDFVFDGGTIASKAAETLCSIYSQNKKVAKKKK